MRVWSFRSPDAGATGEDGERRKSVMPGDDVFWRCSGMRREVARPCADRCPPKNSATQRARLKLQRTVFAGIRTILRIAWGVSQ